MPSIEQLQRLLAADPDDAFVLYGLAQEFAKAGDTERALGHFDRCLTADPAYLYAYFHKARVLHRAGRTEEARATADAGLAAARAAKDSHAASELEALREDLE